MAAPSELLVDLHVKFVQSLDTKRNDLAYYFTEHLRMNGVYWGLTALALMGREDALPKADLLAWVMSCWDDKVDVLSMQTPEGSFAGDQWGERDSRFSYLAVSILSLLGRLEELDKERTIGFITRCRNFDGGFGMVEGAESHAAYVWTCVGALAMLDRLDLVDSDTLCWWLCERQLPNGGLNGRPEKLEDVCYSWWALASLSILGRAHWIDGAKLSKFILSSQDPDKGGIADRPEDVADVWHTVFGLAGLALLSHPGLEEVDPVYCMPAAVTKRLGLRK
ncbi:hypothetical protein RQP46_009655 [Phenoliferia psychrophenolica]